MPMARPNLSRRFGSFRRVRENHGFFRLSWDNYHSRSLVGSNTYYSMDSWIKIPSWLLRNNDPSCKPKPDKYNRPCRRLRYWTINPCIFRPDPICFVTNHQPTRSWLCWINSGMPRCLGHPIVCVDSWPCNNREPCKARRTVKLSSIDKHNI